MIFAYIAVSPLPEAAWSGLLGGTDDARWRARQLQVMVHSRQLCAAVGWVAVSAAIGLSDEFS